MNGLAAAIQWLTTLPVAGEPRQIGACAPWFPVVGGLVGTVVAMTLWAGRRVDPMLGGLLGTIAWLGITGLLHLDGLADLADGVGAGHHEPARILTVMKDPHTGSFGATAIALQIVAKVVLLSLLTRKNYAVALPLIAAWARLGAWWWAVTLPPLGGGLGCRMAEEAPRAGIFRWGILLLLLSLSLIPTLAIAPLLFLMWEHFLRRRLAGMNGDALGAGIETCEGILLLAVVAFG